jgi:hypothetical protein
LLGKKIAGKVASQAVGRTLGRAAGSVIGGPVGLGIGIGSMAPSAGYKDTHNLNGLTDDQIAKEIESIRQAEAADGPTLRGIGRSMRNNVGSLGAGVYDALNWGQRQFTGKNYPHDDYRSRLTALESELARRREGRQMQSSPSRNSRALAAVLNRQTAVRFARDPGENPLAAQLLSFLQRYAPAQVDGVNVFVRPDADEVWIEVLPWAMPEMVQVIEAEAVRIFGRDKVTTDDARHVAGPQWVNLNGLAGMGA